MQGQKSGDCSKTNNLGNRREIIGIMWPGYLRMSEYFCKFVRRRHGVLRINNNVTTTENRQNNDDIHVFLHAVLWHLQCHYFDDCFYLESGLEIVVTPFSCWKVKISYHELNYFYTKNQS